MTTRVHVNGPALRSGKPAALSVYKGRHHMRASRVEFTGPATLVYAPRRKWKGYIKAWVETEHPVKVFDGRRRVA